MYCFLVFIFFFIYFLNSFGFCQGETSILIPCIVFLLSFSLFVEKMEFWYYLSLFSTELTRSIHFLSWVCEFPLCGLYLTFDFIWSNLSFFVVLSWSIYSSIYIGIRGILDFYSVHNLKVLAKYGALIAWFCNLVICWESTPLIIYWEWLVDE